MTLPAERISPEEPLVVCACHYCEAELCEGEYAVRYAGRIYCNRVCLLDELTIDEAPVEFLACGYPSAPDTTWERDER